jgi:hypothetical protein
MALGRAAHNNKKGAYGSLTVRDVHAFKGPWTSEADGSVFGAIAWGHLAHYLGRRQRRLLDKAKVLEAERDRETLVVRTRRLIVAEAYWALANHHLFTYRQFRPYPASLRVSEAANTVDCSAFATLCFRAGGAPDPNGRGYDGLGYTGTLWGQGAPTGLPAAGDLAFYGDMGPVFGHAPSHVALVVDGAFVISDGHTPISKYPVRYRSDYRGSRRYAMAA